MVMEVNCEQRYCDIMLENEVLFIIQYNILKKFSSHLLARLRLHSHAVCVPSPTSSFCHNAAALRSGRPGIKQTFEDL